MAEKEYIERGALLQDLALVPDYWYKGRTINRRLNEQHTCDVVEVVRCKDCKHAAFYSCKNDACYRGIICEYRVGPDDENFFCGYGERKE